MVFDLTAGLPLADVRTDTAKIDLGQPENRWHLGNGWVSEGWDRRARTMYVLAQGEEATLRFRASEESVLAIALFGRPRGWVPRGDVRLELSVNGVVCGVHEIERRFRRYAARVPKGSVRLGTNEIGLRWIGGDLDGEAPSMAWDKLEIIRRPGGTVPQPRRLADGTSLLLPGGVRLDYHLELPARAELEIERVSFPGGAAGVLDIVIEEDGADPRRLMRIEEPAADLRVDLGDFASHVVRLTLEAVPQGSAVTGSAGVVLSSAAISAPGLGAKEHRGADERRGNQPPRSATDPRNVLLYVVDTLRADHLGVYGYAKPVSPHLDRFAEQATVFENAVAQSSWTRAAMASVLTGLWPVRHDTNGRRDVLSPEAITLAEILRENGYQTLSLTANWNLQWRFGLSQGFDSAHMFGAGQAYRLNQEAADWLDARDPERPFFVWLQPVDPHAPYVPPEEFRRRFYDSEVEPLELTRAPSGKLMREMSEEDRRHLTRHLLQLYDGEIAAADEAFGTMIEMLVERGLLENTLVIFMSDHGEEFRDHGGWRHGRNLYAETLNIPLVIRFPGRGRAERVEDVVQHVDLLPTILEYAGLPALEGAEGRSLYGLLDGRHGGAGGSARGRAFSFLHLDGQAHLSVVDGEWKLIRKLVSSRSGETSLFNRAQDPGETRNRVLDQPIRARFLELLLAARLSEGRLLTTSEAEIDEETRRGLEALGYL